MNDEDGFSELYSKIEGISPMIESKPELKKQFEEDIKKYKTLLKRKYEESFDDEAEEGSFYYYNGCHGYLESDCEPYEDIPNSVKDYILEKNKPVTFIIHKKTPVFTSVMVGKFTETGSLAFQVDSEEYMKYLKLEYKLNEDTENIELTIYVYNNNSSKPIEIKDNEGVPNIRLEYHNKDFNMGYFPLIHGPTDDIFYVSKTKFTDGGFFQGTYIFPKLVADFEYTITDKKGSYFSSSLFSMEESLLERCFSDLLGHYKDKERWEEFEDDSVEEIEINIFNSSCLYSTKELSKDIIKQYPQWAKVMAEEIKTSLEDNPLLRGSKRRKKSGSRKKRTKKKKSKNKRSYKKKKKNKYKKSGSKKKK